MILLVWLVVLITAVSLYFKQVYSRFSKYGVKHFKVIPFFGNTTRIFFRLDRISDDLDKTYNTFSEERFVGRYEIIKPIIVVRDLELIKRITIKDFEHFIDHRSFVDKSTEPLFARNLFSLKGEEWKDMRSTLSPAFTSSKIKLMMPFIEEIGTQMIRALHKKLEESRNSSMNVECKDLTTRYANDVIASCAFGVKVDSFSNENNKFYEMGKVTATFKFRQMLLFFIVSTFPSFTKILKFNVFPKEPKEFFLKLVTNTMKDREAHNIIRPDMIHLLMEAKKGQLSHDKKGDCENRQDTGFATVEESSVGKQTTDRVWSETDIVAQAMLFFIAGFETVSTAMSFALHELAIHPEIQTRLVAEIKEHNLLNGGKPNFTSIQNMTYLDMVTSEVLRLWPPVLALDRLCVKDYNMGKPNCKSTEDYIIKKGELIAIPTWCFHHDPKYFPDPMKFDPERFSEENKHNINPNAYMPFGLGPRNCIGSRFALCELKVLLYLILLNFEVYPSEKTRLPAKLSKDNINPRLEGGHWLRFKIRI